MLILTTTLMNAQTNLTPPVAPQVAHQEVRHGATVTDNYFWLREKTNPEVTKYLEAENAYTAAMTKGIQPFADSLYKEMLSHIKQTDLDVPVRRGEYLYYVRTEEGKQYPIRCRRKGSMDAPEEVLLDLNELAVGKKFVGLGAAVVSDDQNLMAYTLDYSGFRQYTLHVKDLSTGQTYADSAERVTSVEWAADNKTLFYTTEDDVTKRPDTLFRHTLGAQASEKIYHEADELYDIGLEKTRDKKFLLLEIESKDTTEFRYLRATEQSKEFAVFLPREKKHRYYVDHRENEFLIRTNRSRDGKELKDFEVAMTPDNKPALCRDTCAGLTHLLEIIDSKSVSTYVFLFISS
jgi:oligopeptidase B